MGAVGQATRTIRVERLGARPDFVLTARYGYRPVAFGLNFPDFFSAFVGLRLPIWAKLMTVFAIMLGLVPALWSHGSGARDGDVHRADAGGDSGAVLPVAPPGA